MKKLFTSFIVMLLSLCISASAFDPAVSDGLFYKEGNFSADREYLENALLSSTDDEEKSEILWRLSRNTLTQGDFIDESDKEGRFEAYEKAAYQAVDSIKAFPNPNAYHWKSSAMGRWGQTRGIFESLKQAPGMRDQVLMVLDEFGYDYTDSWYVLGLLYNQLPGSPISFGNYRWAVSYMRKSLDTQLPGRGLYLTNYIELADQLWDRNWNIKKRTKEFAKMHEEWQNTENEPMSVHNAYYEGKEGGNDVPFYSSVPLLKMSDRQEAVMIMRYADALFQTKKDPKPALLKQKKMIDERLESWT